MNGWASRAVRSGGVLLCLLTVSGMGAFAQSAPQPENRADATMDAKIAALSTSLDQTREELAESREEIRQLRVLLEKVSEKLDLPEGDTTGAGLAETKEPVGQSGPQDAGENPQAARITQDDWDVLNSRLDEQRQVKVESASKFPLRISGMFLFNAIVNSGRVDNLDLPTFATPGTGSFGSTGFSVRQSIIGIAGQGPQIFGASTSADVQTDFFGGMPGGYEASTDGLVRLRVARMRMDWAHTSIVGGLDTPFFSPNSPTSYLTVAEPGFSGSGNLWTWSPQVRLEQKFDTQNVELGAEAGVLDVPSYAPAGSANRTPSPGEISRQPAYAMRLSANGRSSEHPFSLGIAGVYLEQTFPGQVTINGSGGMADWKSPVFPHAELSGEIFTGKGLDGFGAAPVPAVTAQNYAQYNTISSPALARIPMYGGWAQLKFTLNSRSEVNFAAGGAGRDANAFRREAVTDSVVQALPFKNESLTINYVFRPRSDLLFSTEYRRLRTYQISGVTAAAGETGFTAGFLF
jgi:hypothetical protein